MEAIQTGTDERRGPSQFPNRLVGGERSRSSGQVETTGVATHRVREVQNIATASSTVNQLPVSSTSS